MQSYFPFFLLSLGLNHFVSGQDQNVQFNQIANLNGNVSLHTWETWPTITSFWTPILTNTLVDATQQTDLP